MSAEISTPPNPGIVAGSRQADALRFVAQYGVIAAMIITFIGFSLAKPDSFLTALTMKAIIRDAAPLLIVAVGITVVLVVNEFDLSIAGLAGLCATVGVIGVSSAKLGLPVPVGILLAIVVGAGLGALSGFLIAFLGASSFIITLAMGTLLNGVDTQILGSSTIFEGIPAGYTSLANGTILGISNQTFIALAIALVIGLMLRHLEVGRYLYSIGGNREAARLSGVRVKLLTAGVFAVSGACVAAAGVLVSAQSASATANSGAGFLLPAYAAAFLGSAMWRPGTFTVFGTLLGVLFLQIIGTGLSLFSLSGAIVSIIQGAILVVAVLLSRVGKTA